ncbi:MAG: hypothetical protein Kow0047_21520 [Anaerolineae bacterium]
MSLSPEDSIPEAALVAGVFALSLLLRLVAVHVPINVDEALWMRRGPQFFAALTSGDLAATYVRHHPGVPNMWLIGTVTWLRCLLRGWFPSTLGLHQADSVAACIQVLIDSPYFPLSFYVSVRLVQGLITSALITIAYLLLRQLLGRRLALLAVILVSLEPFFLAYQRSITTDALETDFTLISLLLLALYLRSDETRGRLILSGAIMGLAVATKIPAVLVWPAVLIWIAAIELGLGSETFPRRGWRRRVEEMALWGAAALAVIVLIWPTLWVSPVDTVRRLIVDLQEEVEGHNQFFLGHLTRTPGPLYYFVVLPLRTTPIIQVGALLGLIALVWPRWRSRLDHAREIAALTLPGVIIFGLLSFSSKQIDRYIVPQMPYYAILAAAGWHVAAESLSPRLAEWRRRLSERDAIRRLVEARLTLPVAMLVIQLILLVPAMPYFLTYFNPLLGGARTAERLIMVGNGEGLDRAAHWLNQQHQESPPQVASWYPQSFAPYYRGWTVDVRKNWSTNTWPWTTAQRVVLYVNQFQRQQPDPMIIDYFEHERLLHKVRIDGVDYALIYPGPIPAADDLAKIPTPLTATFGDEIRLLGFDLITPQVASGDDLSIALYWEILNPPPADATVYIGLRDAQGNRWGRSDQRPLAGFVVERDFSPGRTFRDVHYLTVLPGTPPGTYQLEVGWFSPQEGRALEARDSAGNPQGARMVIGTVEVTRPSQPPELNILDIEQPIDLQIGSLRLLGYERPMTVSRAGEALPLTLFWQRVGTEPAPYQVSLQLRQGDHIWQRERKHPVSPAYPPDQWQPDEIVREQWHALLPTRAPSGRYELYLIFSDTNGIPVEELDMGPIDIVARPHRFDLPVTPYPSQAIFGEAIRLLGYEVRPLSLSPGGELELVLYWQSLREIDEDLKVFVHLVDANGQIRAQSDRIPQGGKAPTVSWIQGEVIADRHTLALPADLPTGAYAIRVGFYDPLSWARLPLTSGGAEADFVTLSPGLKVSP